MVLFILRKWSRGVRHLLEKYIIESRIPKYVRVPARDVPYGFLLRENGGRRVGFGMSWVVSGISGFERDFLCGIGRGYCSKVR